MLALLGLSSTAPEFLFFLAAVIFTASFAFGWATDLVMRDAGFGIIGNALIGTIGAVLGARVWSAWLGHGTPHGTDAVQMLLYAGSAGTLLLCAATLLKKAVARV